ncbi:50S ribosomal protein L5 [Candidatus Woesearchaeota archaeon]|nr:50S ribosomal protein L5 [Candidatus Woesearchaeota archaeon]
MTNKMRDIRIEKLTLNFGAGKDQDKLAKGIKLLEMVAGKPPVKCITKKRIPTWGLRPGLPVGCKVTLRKKAAHELLVKLLKARENLTTDHFDNFGNLSFGILEYMDIEGMKYDPEIGMIGFQVCVTFEKPGYRVKRRKLHSKEIGKNHVITKGDAIQYVKNNFKIEVVEK